MNEKRDIFEEAIKALEREEGLESLRTSVSEEEFKEIERVFVALTDAKKNILPNKDALRVILSGQSRYNNREKGRVVSFASIMKINWKIVAPLGAFAVLALAFVFYSGGIFPVSMRGTDVNEESALNKEGSKDIAVLEKPLPKPTGNIDDAVDALLMDMDDELAAFERGVDDELLVAESEWRELESLNYEETQI